MKIPNQIFEFKLLAHNLLTIEIQNESTCARPAMRHLYEFWIIRT